MLHARIETGMSFTDDWIKKKWSIQTMELVFRYNRNEELAYATTHMNLETLWYMKESRY